MILVVLLTTIKTFFYLRVFKNLSFIVAMLIQVIFDLKVFLILYALIVTLMGLIICVLGLGNNKIGAYKEFMDNLPDDWGESLPGSEYDYIGMFFGNIIYVLRTSMGDFDFGAIGFLTWEENILFWIVWVLIVSLTSLIFLNFIISEIGASYSDCKSTLPLKNL